MAARQTGIATPATASGDPAVPEVLSGRKPGAAPVQGTVDRAGARQIKYVFVIYQENRSFDSYFGTFPGADGLYSQPADQTPGFYQEILNTDGSILHIQPFRIGPKEFAADTDDVDHSILHWPRRWTWSRSGPDGQVRPGRGVEVLQGRQALCHGQAVRRIDHGLRGRRYVPFLWRMRTASVLFDRIFQAMNGPSTPGNLAIIAAQSGQTQVALHPDQTYRDDGTGERRAGHERQGSVLGIADKRSTIQGKQPVNPKDYSRV